MGAFALGDEQQCGARGRRSGRRGGVGNVQFLVL